MTPNLSRKLGPIAEPIFTEVTVTGLTASRIVASDSNKKLVSADLDAWIAGTSNQVIVTDEGDGTVTLSTPQDIHTGATPTFAGLTISANGDITLSGTGHITSGSEGFIVGTLTISDGSIDDTDGSIAFGDTNFTGVGTIDSGIIRSTDVVQATDFAKTGWPAASGVTFSFDNGTLTFTVTDGGSAYYYINGIKYILGGNKTVVIDDTEGLWYIYFDGATLTASQTIWSFRTEDKALVAYLYWDATNKKKILLGWEPHTFHMSGSIHARLHHAGGAKWEAGLLVSDAGSELINVSAGDIWDEDLNISITDGAGAGLFEQVLSPAELPVYYRDGASAWRIYETTDKAIATDAGYVDGSNDLKYNKLNGTWANATVGLNNYVAYYVIATNEQTK